MSRYVNPVDPPDLGLLPTFRRLLGIWREQWKLGVFGLSCSLVYTLISITIPLLIQRAIDNSIAPKHGHHRQALWPYLTSQRIQRTARPSSAAIASLLRSSTSATLKGMAAGRETGHHTAAAITH